MPFLSSIRAQRSGTSAARMSTIQEDAPYIPVSKRPSFRPMSNSIYLGRPPSRTSDDPPPPYVFPGPKFGTETYVEANQRSIHSIRGSRKWAAIALLLVTCLIVLVLGLSLGLRHRRGSDNSKDHGPDSSAPAVPIFPAGSYTIPTLLTNTTTNCTSNPSTWRCFPYTTYSSSTTTTSSSASFLWTISQSPKNTNNYTISASPSDFAPTFSSIPLLLQDAGLATEHYSFTLNITKAVIPNVALNDENVAATCYFNETMFVGMLYTGMRRLYPEGNGTGEGEWPYAVEVMEVAGGGEGVPNCYDGQGEEIGTFVVEGSGDECGCTYSNYGFEVTS